MNVTVRVWALVFSTEIEEKVKTAIMSVLPIKVELQDFGIPRLCGEGDLGNLRKLHQLLREERILDTARNIMLNGIEGNVVQFRLNKQVAYIGKVNFPAGEESLGSIYIEISCDNEEDILKIINWLAPQTVDGKPVEEIEL
jgi:predicted RNA binding protein with dsRBD fold (UPF0201 family)